MSARSLLKLFQLAPLLGDAIVTLLNELIFGYKGSEFDFLKVALGVALPKAGTNAEGKPNTRPIAINEIIVNICGKLMLAQVGPYIMSQLHPDNLGFGTKSACPSLVHNAALLWSLSGSPLVFLSCDFINAYNSVFRKKIFEVAAKYCPCMLRFQKWRCKFSFKISLPLSQLTQKLVFHRVIL